MAAHKDCQEKDYNQLFDDILDDIVEKNWSASKALAIGPDGKRRMSFSKFWDILDKDENRAKQYARACVLRAERVNDEIMEIADESEFDTTTCTRMDGSEYEKPNTEYMNRSRLRIDARKWWLSKTNPKKYGDKLDVTTDNKAIQSNVNITKQVIDDLVKEL